MTARTTPPFRADHVGSLLRPPALLAAREAHRQGRLDAAGLRAAEDSAIADIVRKQEDVGLQAVTDGEFRRASWHMDFIYQIGGIRKVDDNIVVRFKTADEKIEFTPPAARVVEPLRLDRTIFGEAFSHLQGLTSRVAKLTIPSPSMVHYRGGRRAIDAAVYPDLDRFYDDLASVYRQEIAALARLGCRYLQLDDTSLAYLNDPAQREHVRAIGGDPDRQHEIYIRILNAALKDKPKDMAVTTHLCRGNFRSAWAAEGGYDFVAEALFGQLAVDGFFLEYDDERSGGFAPLRFVPKGKQVVLGLVTTKSGELEDKDDLKRRIDQAAKFVPLDQLCLSPQCGFSSTVEGNRLSGDQQFAKLRLIVETAREVWD
jgi:5-methyltetrahydropteroyltriglutamate--homocysteine methyltransferase